MNSVKNIEHFDELVSGCRERKNTGNINCLLLPDELESLTRAGTLYYEEFDGGLSFFHDREKYYILSVFSDKESPFYMKPKNKPVVTEFQGFNKLSAKSASMITRLEKFNFKASAVTRRMVVKTREFINNKKPVDTKTMGYKVMFAVPEHTAAIMEVWENSFDPAVNLLPAANELAEIIRDGNVICAINEDNRVIGNQVIGALQVGFNKEAGWIRHEAVLPEFRGKKIGSAMSGFFLDAAGKREVERIFLYVIETHDRAVNFHKKFGFEFDGRIMAQYIY
ncbi:MAG: GNAT family N-acetyltransferase [Oscillospiraceae bacterium]|nr:GNAT family N-acetyltransferase [Oscillospiraceae bacterium]